MAPMTQEIETKSESTDGYSARILAVEDNLVNQKVIRGMLMKLGCDCDVAADGAEALALVERHQYKLIFMDCQMPIMDGYQATLKIKERISNGQLAPIPVIALTANALVGDKERCMEAGMDDFLAKPVKMDSLGAMLAKWITEN